ncbi:hypothetical protein FOS06_08255 [Niallia circulans]|nr:hypothetical protein [Niallia circulans]
MIVSNTVDANVIVPSHEQHCVFFMGIWVEPRVNALVPFIRDECVFCFYNFIICDEKDMNYFYCYQRGKDRCELPSKGK